MASNSEKSQMLFACTHCHHRCKFEELSGSQQLCKVCELSLIDRHLCIILCLVALDFIYYIVHVPYRWLYTHCRTVGSSSPLWHVRTADWSSTQSSKPVLLCLNILLATVFMCRSSTDHGSSRPACEHCAREFRQHGTVSASAACLLAIVAIFLL